MCVTHGVFLILKYSMQKWLYNHFGVAEEKEKSSFEWFYFPRHSVTITKNPICSSIGWKTGRIHLIYSFLPLKLRNYLVGLQCNFSLSIPNYSPWGGQEAYRTWVKKTMLAACHFFIFDIIFLGLCVKPRGSPFSEWYFLNWEWLSFKDDVQKAK